MQENSSEDTLNFINASGIIDKIEITNSLSDGLDVDFSNLKINQISITKSEMIVQIFLLGIIQLTI